MFSVLLTCPCLIRLTQDHHSMNRETPFICLLALNWDEPKELDVWPYTQFWHASSPSQKNKLHLFWGFEIFISGQGGNKNILARDIDFHDTNNVFSFNIKLFRPITIFCGILHIQNECKEYSMEYCLDFYPNLQ